MLAFLLTVAEESDQPKIKYIYDSFHDDMMRFAIASSARQPEGLTFLMQRMPYKAPL